MNTEDSFSIHPAADSDLLQLTDVWEVSVRATHHFLKEEDLLFYKNQIGHYLKECNLFLVKAEGGKKQFQNSNSRIVGFIGIQDRMIEMLFIHPVYRHQGIGSRLMEYARQEFGCNQVDVNEQNNRPCDFILTGDSGKQDGMPTTAAIGHTLFYIWSYHQPNKLSPPPKKDSTVTHSFRD